MKTSTSPTRPSSDRHFYNTLTITATILITSVIVSATPPPDDAREYAGSSYKLFQKVGISWKEAKAQCEEMGGHLVVIDSKTESRFVHRFIKKNEHDAWIGVFATGEGKPEWVNKANFEGDLLEGYEDKLIYKKNQYGVINKKGDFDTRLNSAVNRVDFFLCEWDSK